MRVSGTYSFASPAYSSSMKSPACSPCAMVAKPEELADAVLRVDHVIAGLQVGDVRPGRRRRPSCRGRAGRSAPEVSNRSSDPKTTSCESVKDDAAADAPLDQVRARDRARQIGALGEIRRGAFRWCRCPSWNGIVYSCRMSASRSSSPLEGAKNTTRAAALHQGARLPPRPPACCRGTSSTAGRDVKRLRQRVGRSTPARERSTEVAVRLRLSAARPSVKKLFSGGIVGRLLGRRAGASTGARLRCAICSGSSQTTIGVLRISCNSDPVRGRATGTQYSQPGNSSPGTAMRSPGDARASS